MKICPTCKKSYDEERSFCVNDGDLLDDMEDENAGSTAADAGEASAGDSEGPGEQESPRPKRPLPGPRVDLNARLAELRSRQPGKPKATGPPAVDTEKKRARPPTEEVEELEEIGEVQPQREEKPKRPAPSELPPLPASVKRVPSFRPPVVFDTSESEALSTFEKNRPSPENPEPPASEPAPEPPPPDRVPFQQASDPSSVSALGEEARPLPNPTATPEASPAPVVAPAPVETPAPVQTPMSFDAGSDTGDLLDRKRGKLWLLGGGITVALVVVVITAFALGGGEGETKAVPEAKATTMSRPTAVRAAVTPDAAQRAALGPDAEVRAAAKPDVEVNAAARPDAGPPAPLEVTKRPAREKKQARSRRRARRASPRSRRRRHKRRRRRKKRILQTTVDPFAN